MVDVDLLFEQVVKEVTPGNWRKCIQHAIKEEEKMWHLDKIIDQTIDPLIIISRGEDTSLDDEE